MPFAITRFLLSLIEGVITGTAFAPRAAKKAAHEEARQQYFGYRSVGASANLNPRAAQILDTNESFIYNNFEVQNYVLTLFVVTSENQYFLFKSNKLGQPYVNQINKDRAKLALKGKFQRFEQRAAYPSFERPASLPLNQHVRPPE